MKFQSDTEWNSMDFCKWVVDNLDRMGSTPIGPKKWKAYKDKILSMCEERGLTVQARKVVMNPEDVVKGYEKYWVLEITGRTKERRSVYGA